MELKVLKQSHIPGSTSTEVSPTYMAESNHVDNLESTQVQKSVSLDKGPCHSDGEGLKRPMSGSFKRRSIRRRPSKRLTERPDSNFGHDSDTYEAIRQRVLQERAVTNAIEALQERWRMLTFMYDDCLELNEGRKDRRFKKLLIQRQFELIVIISIFVVITLPIFVILVLICR